MNLLFYACLLDNLIDGTLLDPPPSCMHRFEHSITHDEECKHKSTPTREGTVEATREEDGAMEEGVQAEQPKNQVSVCAKAETFCCHRTARPPDQTVR